MIDHNPHHPPVPETVKSWDGYLYFVWEREAMRLAKENGHTGLTEDPVLARYRFTNIRRRDDRMSRWFIEHLIKPFSNRDDLWFALLIGRLVNWPPTLQALLDAGVIPCAPSQFNADKFSAVLEGCKAAGVKVYGGAYMVFPTLKDPGGVKSKSIAKWIIGDAVLQSDKIHASLWAAGEEPSIERFVNALSTCYGVSTFIAGQVAADLTYDDGHLGVATDLYLYAPLGPGSQKGLNFLFEHTPNHTWKPYDFNLALMDANHRVCEELEITDLTLHDVQNTMCEYSKYVKAICGDGNPKSTYQPETSY